uniref:Uncharacterized protein n=1 Tax=Ciona savignyi TaxID=51511 RepID=H2Y9J4_CIOSA
MCLCEYNQLHPVWLEYINAMDMLLSRLKGPFNVEVLLRRIDLTISDAIMTVQENEKEITKVVFHHCGEPQQNPNTTHPMMNMGYEPPPPGFPQMTSDDTNTIPYPSLYPGYQGPSNFDNLASYTDAWDDEISQGDLPLSRKTRSTKKSRKEKRKRNRSRDVEHQRHFRRPHAVEDKYEYREDAFEPAPSNGNNLETLLSEVRIMLESARHHWSRMEEGVCGDAVGGEECWNGGSIGRYESKVVKPDASCTDYNPENEPPAHMEPSVHEEPPVHTKHAIRSQVVVLRDTIIKLRMAHNGVDESTEDHDTEIATDVESSGEESSGDIGSGEVPNQPGAHEVAAPECMDCNPGNHGNHLSINLVTITTTIFITMLNMV